MMTWLSIHFYPLETENVFLTRAVKPFLEQYIWPRQGARAFFIRYEDEKGRHIRLRLRGEADWIEETLRPALAGWFEGRGEQVQAGYKPETERFGGAVGLALAEEYFHVSTRVVLERLNRDQFTYGDAMFDALRMHTITAFAWASGLIEYTTPVRRRTVPEGALPIATGPEKILKDIIEAIARHGQGASKNKLLVPGIPEASMMKYDPLVKLIEFKAAVQRSLKRRGFETAA